MNPELNDNRIKELFLEVKRDQARSAPAFADVWKAAVAGHLQRRRLYFRRVTAAAALLVLLATATNLMLKRPQPFRNDASAEPELPWKSEVLISQWRAPTDFLLETPWPIRNENKVPSYE